MSIHGKLAACSVGYCTRPVGNNNRDLCSQHYANLVRHRNPRLGPQPRNLEPGSGLLARIARRLGGAS